MIKKINNWILHSINFINFFTSKNILKISDAIYMKIKKEILV